MFVKSHLKILIAPSFRSFIRMFRWWSRSPPSYKMFGRWTRVAVSSYEIILPYDGCRAKLWRQKPEIPVDDFLYHGWSTLEAGSMEIIRFVFDEPSKMAEVFIS